MKFKFQNNNAAINDHNTIIRQKDHGHVLRQYAGEQTTRVTCIYWRMLAYYFLVFVGMRSISVQKSVSMASGINVPM